MTDMTTPIDRGWKANRRARTDDTLVSPHHSTDLAARLRAAGVPTTLVLVKHTGHTVATPGQQPGPAEIERTVRDFFARTLAASPVAA